MYSWNDLFHTPTIHLLCKSMLLLTTKPICPTFPMQHKLVKHTSLSCNIFNDEQDLDTLKLKNAYDTSISKKGSAKRKKHPQTIAKKTHQCFRHSDKLFPHLLLKVIKSKMKKVWKDNSSPFALHIPQYHFHLTLDFTNSWTINKQVLHLPSQLYFIPSHKLALVFRKPVKCLPGYH